MSRTVRASGSSRRRLRARGLAAAVLSGFLAALTPSVGNAAPGDDKPTGSANAIVHQPPRVPLTIDGIPASPETMAKYNGIPLYMAAMPDERSQGRLVVFTRPADFERFVRDNGGPVNALAAPSVATGDQIRSAHGDGRSAGEAAPASAGGAYIYEHSQRWGYSLLVRHGQGWPDLTQVRMTCDWYFFCTSWNDQASSAVPDYGGACTVNCGQMLWEHTWWGGSALWISRGYWVPDLGAFGWNDRVSSFASYG